MKRSMTVSEARTLAEQVGLDIHDDVDTLSRDDIQKVLHIAKLYGYRAPKTANHAKSHMFWQFMQRGIK